MGELERVLWFMGQGCFQKKDLQLAEKRAQHPVNTPRMRSQNAQSISNQHSPASWSCPLLAAGQRKICGVLGKRAQCRVQSSLSEQIPSPRRSKAVTRRLGCFSSWPDFQVFQNVPVSPNLVSLAVAFNHQLYPSCILGAALTKCHNFRNYRVVRTKALCRKEQLYINSHNVIFPQMIGF